MNTTLTRKLLAGAAALACLGPAMAAGGSMSITPALPSALPGETLVLTLAGSGFADAVLGGGFGMTWNPAVLALQSLSVDAVTWEFARGTGTVNAAAGTLSDAFFASNRAVLPTGSFPVGEARFMALAPGNSAVTLGGSPLFPWVSELGAEINVAYGSTSVAVVPEPGTWALFGVGLAAMPWLRRRLAAQPAA